jgi:hypothetical protein
MAEKHPYRTWRTGTEAFTIIEAHPYHKAVKWWIAGTKNRSISQTRPKPNKSATRGNKPC